MVCIYIYIYTYVCVGSQITSHARSLCFGPQSSSKMRAHPPSGLRFWALPSEENFPPRLRPGNRVCPHLEAAKPGALFRG